jgi:hypothetical protein
MVGRTVAVADRRSTGPPCAPEQFWRSRVPTSARPGGEMTRSKKLCIHSPRPGNLISLLGGSSEHRAGRRRPWQKQVTTQKHTPSLPASPPPFQEFTSEPFCRPQRCIDGAARRFVGAGRSFVDAGRCFVDAGGLWRSPVRIQTHSTATSAHLHPGILADQTPNREKGHVW